MRGRRYNFQEATLKLKKNKSKILHHDRLKPYESDIIPGWAFEMQRKLCNDQNVDKLDRVPGNVDTKITKKTVQSQKLVPKSKVRHKECDNQNSNLSEGLLRRSQRTHRQPDRYGLLIGDSINSDENLDDNI